MFHVNTVSKLTSSMVYNHRIRAT